MANRDLRTILRTMPPDELSFLLEKLIAVAERILRMHGPRARHYHLTGEDVVHEMLTRVLSGTRMSCPADVPVFFVLARMVSSIISHASVRPENRKQRIAIDDVAELAADDDVELSVLSRVEREEFRKELEQEPELQAHYDLRVAAAGFSDQELALEAGKSVQRIRTLNRKLARRWRARLHRAS